MITPLPSVTPSAAPTARARRRPSMRRLFLVDHLDLPAATGVEDAQWEYFQIDHLDDEGIFRIENKSRQIAWSWLSAAEAVAEAHADLWGDQPRDSIFVSIRQEEAAEKIRYAKKIYETLAERIGIGPGKMHPIVKDSYLNLEFNNGTRLTSFPAVPPRGRARADLYLDEFAHVQRDNEIYTAALPIISKGGRLRIGSSPFGAVGRFWEVWSQAIRPYPGYTRKATPWYETHAFTTDVHQARRLAPTMATAERVAQFGNSRIAAIHDNMDEDDFRQEYETEIVDESRSYFTWEEIKAIQRDDLYCELATVKGADIMPALEAIQRLAASIGQMRAESVLTFGYDVGRTRNTSELFIVGLSPSGDLPLRAALSLDNTPYDEQEQVLRYALNLLPILRGWIDQNGIGNQLAETLQRAYPAKVQPAIFTNDSKQLWMTNTKMLVQKRRVLLPADRDLTYQIHSIKKMITASKNNIFDTDANEKHHADKAWSLALGLSAAIAGEHQIDPEQLAALFSYVG